MGASAAFRGTPPPTSAPQTAVCGACGAHITLTYAQQRWLRWQPTQHVYCNQRCCNAHYQAKRKQRPQARQEEYQRARRQRRDTGAGARVGVIHSTDQGLLGGGWSWLPLPTYSQYRCTCQPGVTCEACRTWREPREDR